MTRAWFKNQRDAAKRAATLTTIADEIRSGRTEYDHE